MHAPRQPNSRGALARTGRCLRAAAPWVAALALNCALFLPSHFHNHRHVWRISMDFAALTGLALLSARSRARRWVAGLAAVYYVLLWLFLTYDHAVAHYFERTPALSEDIRLALNLWHYLEGSAQHAWLIVLGGWLGLCLLAYAAYRTWRALQLQAARWSFRRRLLWAVGWLVPALISLSWYGVQRDGPLMQLTSKRVLWNYRASRAESARMAELRSTPPDLRYEAFSQVALRKKPDVYLLMLEAYGEILATWDMREAYEALMAQVQARLSHAGYHGASTYSASPVHGGTSWLSIATVHTGVTVDRPQIYAALEGVGARVPSMTRFFREQGYLTHALQPGSLDRTGLHRFELFHHEIPVDGDTIGYHGKKYGWGRIPDQFSLGVFRERYFLPSDRPRYAFYMCLSTHYEWEGVPTHVRDWHALGDPDFDESTADDGWPLPESTARIGSQLRRDYFRSISYEWQLLTEWLEAEAGHDNVVLIVGDHQPRLEWNVPGAVTMNTPVHVLSQDPQLVERFVREGFQPGLFADPGKVTKLQHAGLFSLLITQLAARYATEQDARRATYYPKGLPLAALHR